MTTNTFQNSEIVFLTTTIGTKWIFYQQYLLNKLFPESKKILIDGNLRWDFEKGIDCVWYDFINIALQHKKSHTYFVHIDEDCFITNPDGIVEAIQSLQRGDADLIGPSDVVDSIRGQNPKALNSFLMIGKIAVLEKVMEEYDLSLLFKDLNMPFDPPIAESRIENEPYYEFFWNYYKKGFRIGFIPAGFHKDFKCTTLLTNTGQMFGLHMWYTRNWYSRKITPLGLSHYQRYKRAENYMQEIFEITFPHVLKDMKLWKEYLSIQYSRLVMKNISRVKKRIPFLS